MTRQSKDPGVAFRFKVELSGLLVADFAEVSGLEAENEVYTLREGGVNDYEHHFFTIRKYPPLILRRGFTNTSDLWDWYESTTKGSFSRKDGSIIMLDTQNQESYRWNFLQAYPVKWVGPQLRADTSQVAIESLEIVHQGIALKK